jgi:hypothetical protein
LVRRYFANNVRDRFIRSRNADSSFADIFGVALALVLTFSADGKVSGASADNGCTLLGLRTPGVTPRLFTLDVTLSDCRYAGLNRRYSGTVITAQIDQSVQFTLMVYTVPIPGVPIRRYDVEATLRR